MLDAECLGLNLNTAAGNTVKREGFSRCWEEKKLPLRRGDAGNSTTSPRIGGKKEYY